MAFVKDFVVDGKKGKRHRTIVNAKVRVFSILDQSPIVQIDTFGSSKREIPGKLSQTIQMDKESAKKLFDILRETYGF